jgi:hypothetical protein
MDAMLIDVFNHLDVTVTAQWSPGELRPVQIPRAFFDRSTHDKRKAC